MHPAPAAAEPYVRPILYLDVDDVLNLFTSAKVRKQLVRKHGWRTAWVHHDHYRLTVNPEHGSWIRQAVKTTGAELVWSTSWEHGANSYVSPLLGLPADLRVVGGIRRVVQAGDSKAPLIVSHAGARPFAVFDDWPGLGPEISSLTSTPHLVQRVWDATGLSKHDVDVVTAWLIGQRKKGEPS